MIKLDGQATEPCYHVQDSSVIDFAFIEPGLYHEVFKWMAYASYLNPTIFGVKTKIYQYKLIELDSTRQMGTYSATLNSQKLQLATWWQKFFNALISDIEAPTYI